MIAGGNLRAEQQVLDGVAAVVNGDVITFTQVRELAGARELSLRQMYKDKPAELLEQIKQTRTSAVNELIDRQLVIQEFKKSKASIPEYVIEDQIQSIIREQFGGNRAAFIRTLDAQGYTLDRYREIEKEKIIVQAMRQRAVKNDLMIPPQKIDEYYSQHREDYTAQAQVKLRMIVLKKDGGATDATQRSMAEEIHQKVTSGAEFDKMASLYSQDGSPNGDWGWIDRKTLNPKLSDVAFSLKPGQVSKVIQDGGSYYIMFCEARKDAVTTPLGQVRADIENKLMQAERQKIQEKWLAGLRAKAYIKTF